MAAAGKLIGLDIVTLTTIRDALTEALIAGLKRGQSYTIAGRSFSFSAVSELVNTIAEANQAIGLLTNTTSMVVRANFNPSVGRGSR